MSEVKRYGLKSVRDWVYDGQDEIPCEREVIDVDIEGDYVLHSDHLATVRALEDRVRELEEFAESVVRWSESYPTDIFTEPTPKQIDDVCKLSGFRIDMISEMVLREFTKSWGNKARSVLTRKPQ